MSSAKALLGQYVPDLTRLVQRLLTTSSLNEPDRALTRAGLAALHDLGSVASTVRQFVLLAFGRHTAIDGRRYGAVTAAPRCRHQCPVRRTAARSSPAHPASAPATCQPACPARPSRGPVQRWRSPTVNPIVWACCAAPVSPLQHATSRAAFLFGTTKGHAGIVGESTRRVDWCRLECEDNVRINLGR